MTRLTGLIVGYSLLSVLMVALGLAGLGLHRFSIGVALGMIGVALTTFAVASAGRSAVRVVVISVQTAVLIAATTYFFRPQPPGISGIDKTTFSLGLVLGTQTAKLIYRFPHQPPPTMSPMEARYLTEYLKRIGYPRRDELVGRLQGLCHGAQTAEWTAPPGPLLESLSEVMEPLREFVQSLPGCSDMIPFDMGLNVPSLLCAIKIAEEYDRFRADGALTSEQGRQIRDFFSHGFPKMVRTHQAPFARALKARSFPLDVTKSLYAVAIAELTRESDRAEVKRELLNIVSAFGLER